MMDLLNETRVRRKRVCIFKKNKTKANKLLVLTQMDAKAEEKMWNDYQRDWEDLMIEKH